jgi:hypothetical protein
MNYAVIISIGHRLLAVLGLHRMRPKNVEGMDRKAINNAPESLAWESEQRSQSICSLKSNRIAFLDERRNQMPTRSAGACVENFSALARLGRLRAVASALSPDKFSNACETHDFYPRIAHSKPTTGVFLGFEPGSLCLVLEH